MGAKVRSTIDVVYDPRDQTYGKIIIELVGWTYNIGVGYVANIRDSVEKIVTDPLVAVTLPPTGVLRTKTKSFTIAEVGFLYNEISEQVGPIGENEDYSAYMDKLLANAILYLTKTELKDGQTVYGILPNQWEVVIE